jgi:RNA polymerase sigma-70 factor (ECF subfamily)
MTLAHDERAPRLFAEGLLDPLAPLAHRAGTGDPVAMRQLIDALAAGLLRTVRAVMGGARSGVAGADVEDVCQESLVALVAALGTFRGECQVSHYASRIAVRTSIAARRRTRLEHARLKDVASAGEAQAPLTETPGDSALAARRRELIRALVDELPDTQAEALAMRVMLGYSIDEVARATGAPANTVHSRLRLAKEALRRRIAEDASLSELLETQP